MDDSWAPKASWNCQPDHDLALSECFSPRLCGSSRRCDPSLSWLRHLRRRSDTIDTSTLAALNYLALRLAWTSYFKSNPTPRSEEHTSELQSQSNLVCRLLLEKKNVRA